MRRSKTLSERLTEGRRQYGAKFDPSDLDAAHPSIKDAYNADQRVKVVGPSGERTGIVGSTTGWRPAFLLMHRSNDSASRDVLGPNDHVVATWRGRSYQNGTPYGRVYPVRS